MGARTRIHRRTTATPSASKAPPRFFHVSTRYGWVPVDFTNSAGPSQFVKLGKGSTYRRS